MIDDSTDNVFSESQSPNLRMENALRAALALNQVFQSASEEDILQFALDQCETLTGSSIAFFHFVNPDQATIRLTAWSERTIRICHVPGYEPHYPINEAGVWVDCLRQRKPIIHNDYAGLTHKKGLPAGHVPLSRGVYLPIFEGEQIVGIIGVGNKETDYDQTDVDLLQLLAENVWFALQRRKYQQEREGLLTELSTINNELQSIVYVTSHDLRSPLFSLEGFRNEVEECGRKLQALMKEPNIPAEVRERFEQLMEADFRPSLDYMKASSKRMGSVIDGLLRISRVGTTELFVRRLKMNGLINEILAATEYPLQQLDSALTVEALPDCMGDKDQISQVFSNLVDNAIKYRKPDGRLAIRITGRTEAEMSVYLVEDNGIGIPAGKQQKIFELFCRLVPRGPVVGDGLGLTIVQRILSRNKGSIRVQSEPGAGSTFTVTLPAASRQ